MKFRYEYRTRDNARHEGVIDAPDREGVYAALKAQGVRPSFVAEVPGFFNKLFGKVKQDGLTLVPLSLYFKKQYVKVELGLCKGKKLYDKRETAAKNDAKRNIDRALKSQKRYG